MALFWLSLAILLVLAAIQLTSRLQLARLRRSGLYPERGQATMADIQRLLQNGQTVWALRCYREIHGCSLKQAKAAVAAIRQQQ